MKILFVGDLVGSVGRRCLRTLLPALKQKHEVDFTIANVENSAGGFGVTPKIARQVLSWGVDVMTSGNHVWDKREILPYLDEEPRLLRPANYSSRLPGGGSIVVPSDTAQVAVLNLQGRVFMPLTDCPFERAESEVERLGRKASVIVVDFHAEATSEKLAMGWYLDGKVSAIIGTHTHVPTADARVLPGGTSYISDVGMTGAYDSVIGMEAEGALERFLTGLSTRLKIAKGNPRLCGVVIDVDESSGRARSIERIDEAG